MNCDFGRAASREGRQNAAKRARRLVSALLVVAALLTTALDGSYAAAQGITPLRQRQRAQQPQPPASSAPAQTPPQAQPQTPPASAQTPTPPAQSPAQPQTSPAPAQTPAPPAQTTSQPQSTPSSAQQPQQALPQATTPAQAPKPTSVPSQSRQQPKESVAPADGGRYVVVKPKDPKAAVPMKPFTVDPSTLDPEEARKRMRNLLRVNEKGVQTLYPAIAKIVGRGVSKAESDGSTFIVPLFYGTGEYVAEFGPWGIVVTNWHVVSESDSEINVLFPNRPNCAARCILRDEKWDLAALLIEKPKDLTPIPIAIFAPKIHEYLWAGGYGPKDGLDEFELKCGELVNYVSLDLPKEKAAGGPTDPKYDPLYETEMIELGVRSGDSGGPVFNCYGELAGCLWGSDKKNSMATCGARVSLFVMNALQEAAKLLERQRLDAKTTPESGVVPGMLFTDDAAPNACVKADDRLSSVHNEYAIHAIQQVMDAERENRALTTVPINVRDPKFPNDESKLVKVAEIDVKGLMARLYPVSSTPLYVSANTVDSPQSLKYLSEKSGGAEQTLEQVRRAADAYWQRNLDSLPPNPPIFSPTYVGLQIILNKDQPEVSDADSFALLTKFAADLAESERQPKNHSEWAMDSEDARKIAEAEAAKESAPVADFKEAAAVASNPPVAQIPNVRPGAFPDSPAGPDFPTRPLTKTYSYLLFCVFLVLFILGELWRRSSRRQPRYSRARKRRRY